MQLVGYGSENTDICVLATKERLTPPEFLLPTSLGDYFYGQDAYFLGFPHGMRADIKINDGFPLPFVKRATVSAHSPVTQDDLKAFLPSKQSVLFLDGINNEGFSGGPVVFRKNANLLSELHVVSVIAGYVPEEEFTVANQEIITNSGIIISYSISHAIDAIKANPIGCRLER